ncbi:MAG: serpin family protein [Bradymonadales bacterium]|nr:serpin family protein [Bradymonadales bacterium]
MVLANFHKWLFSSILLLSLTFLFAGCNDTVNDPRDTPNEGGEYLASTKQRVQAPEVASEEMVELVDGNSAFAFDLYQELLKDADGNLFYSPHSISLALAMAFAGAEGNTEAEMAETLHFTLEEARLHSAFNALDQELASRGEGAQGRDGEGFRLKIVNATWGQTGYSFLMSFLDVLAENYGAGLRLLDFRQAPEESRVTINDWVSENTEGRIEDLLQPGVISSDTRLVLTNAIYFNAAWSIQFEEDVTTQEPFQPLEGNQVTVDMMHLSDSLGYTEGDGYQAVELLYDGEELSMVVIVPDAGQFEAFEAGLSSERIAGIIGSMEVANGSLAMPRFEFVSEFSLVETLMALGMIDAFGNADFSGIDGTYNLLISDVVHKAFVAVDEAGTEAAAATAVVFVESAAPMDEFELTIDRPFLFAIRDIPTGALLFVGRVVNPAA